MHASNGVVLYDIPSKLPIRTWSSNVWRTRLVLNYREIPYRTEWISYPDIKDTFIKLGLSPTRFEFDGSPLYTVPSIIDQSTPTPTPVSDSTTIALYLEQAYPPTLFGPSLFPEGTERAQLDFIDSLHVEGFFDDNVTHLMVPLMPSQLFFPKCEEYFTRTKTARFGMAPAEMAPAGSVARKDTLEALKRNLDEIAGVYDLNVEGKGEYFIGKSLTYADVVMVAILLWTKTIPSDRDGEGIGSVWQILEPLNGGRWERLINKFRNCL